VQKLEHGFPPVAAQADFPNFSAAFKRKGWIDQSPIVVSFANRDISRCNSKRLILPPASPALVKNRFSLSVGLHAVRMRFVRFASSNRQETQRRIGS
jgi:hypothetical protein